MDARAATDVCGSSVRRSRVVLTSRCWHYVLEKRSFFADNGGKRAVLREEHEVSRKAIAQGRPECSRCPVCSCAVLFAQIARETAGAASTRSSLRPLIGGQRSYPANLGRNASRDREASYSVVVIAAHEAGRSSIPRDVHVDLQPRSRGVLDTPPSRRMTVIGRAQPARTIDATPASTPHTPSPPPHRTWRDTPARCRCSGRRCGSACPRRWN